MGNYAGIGQATSLDEGRQVEVWANEAVAVNGISTAVKFRRTRGIFYPMAFSVELAFSAAPGAFTVAILTADTDNPTRYVQRGTITQANLNSYNVARAEFTSVWCLFMALQMGLLTNTAALATALVTR